MNKKTKTYLAIAVVGVAAYYLYKHYSDNKKIAAVSAPPTTPSAPANFTGLAGSSPYGDQLFNNVLGRGIQAE
jgi:uncharacterized membrane protein YebE (DUF533 family)